MLNHWQSWISTEYSFELVRYSQLVCWTTDNHEYRTRYSLEFVRYSQLVCWTTDNHEYQKWCCKLIQEFPCYWDTVRLLYAWSLGKFQTQMLLQRHIFLYCFTFFYLPQCILQIFFLVFSPSVLAVFFFIGKFELWSHYISLKLFWLSFRKDTLLNVPTANKKSSNLWVRSTLEAPGWRTVQNWKFIMEI